MVTLIILLLDVLLLPSILKFPVLFLQHGFETPKIWFEQFSIVDGIQMVMDEERYRLLWIVMQGLVFICILLIFWKDVPKKKNRLQDGVGGPEAKGSGQHGTSRWQSERETDQTTTVWKTNQPLNKGGVVLGMVPYNTLSTKALKVWIDTEDTHTLVVGTTRSGKTRTMIYPTIWTLAHAGESMVLSDPKGELYKRTGDYLRSKGYKVVLLDFRNPKRGNHWNPMESVISALEEGDESKAAEAAWDIANSISPKTGHGERIWNDGQQSVMAALILAIASEADDRYQKHLTSVYETLTMLGEPVQTDDGIIIPLNEYFRSLKPGHIARSAYGTAKLAPDRTRGSFFTGASADLKLFSDPNISFLTSHQDHDLKDVGRDKTAVFLVIPDEKSTRHVLASLYIDQCYQALVSLANDHNDRLPVRVNFLLDEFGNLPPIADFDKKITVSAGRGIRFTLIIQDFTQLKKAYKESAQTITGNCHTWMYLLTTDPESANVISKKTGQYTVETENYSSTIQMKGYSTGFSAGLSGRALLTPDEVLRWPKNTSLILRARQFPARLELPDLSQWPADLDFVSKTEDEMKEFKKTPIFIPGMQAEPEVASTAEAREDNQTEELEELVQQEEEKNQPQLSNQGKEDKNLKPVFKETEEEEIDLSDLM